MSLYKNIIKPFNEIDDEIVPEYSSKKLDFFIKSIVFTVICGILIKLIYIDSIFKTIWEVVTVISVYFIALSICYILLCTCNFLTELSLSIKSHYSSEITSWQNAAIFFNGQSIFVSVLLTFSMFLYCSKVDNPLIQTWRLGPIVGFFSLAAAFFLFYMFDMNETIHISDKTIQTMKGIDYGSGMAFSYYYGYLKFILSSDGVNNSGIRSKIETYEANEGITIPVKKLFILIPQSGYIPSDLSDNWLESTKSLQNEIKDRAGTKRRNYKNTVYKIHPDGFGQRHRPVYIVVEGATPIMTLYEIIQHNHEQTEIYRLNKMKIVASFYKTLNKLVDNPSCRDVVDLVYYKDYDNNQKRVNVAEILLKRIRQQAPQSS